jgi:hypothetical protein
MVKTCEQITESQVSRYSAKDWDKTQTKIEKIADLVLDWRLYPRKEVDHQVVKTYANALKAGSVFPPIKVGLFKGDKVVVDGFHRVESRILLKIDYADCSILPFQSEAELFAEAVRLNSSHGKNFTEVELKANIRRLQKYKFNVKDIVALVHVPATEITREMTRPITTVTLPSGKKMPCTQIKPGEAGIHGLLCLKSALMIVCNWAEQDKIPSDEPFIRELVARASAALKKVRFNA